MTASSPVLPPPSLRVLLYHVVDYAGLFPPASLPMEDAIREYARQRAGDDAWALGRFVLPAARLEEFEGAAGGNLPASGAHSWALSALLGSHIEEDLDRIEVFNERHRDPRSGAVIVDTVELKTHTARDIMRASEMLDRRFDTYIEIPVADDPAELIDAISNTIAKAKIRTGGVTEDAFPSSAHVVRFVQRCVAHNVAFKATAGLHHPWRAEYRLTYAPDAPRGVMYGFLNMLLCTAAVIGAFGEGVALGVLEERDPSAVRFDEQGAHWRGTTFSTDMLDQARESIVSFGSCSFAEPVADLRALHLL
ncbi:MAG TPA: hypothetical protein VEB19_00675 [Gemmatimonadaceae bacterium]|nr:hypothetical protein [Gemmatimonadaceae bacterium]